MFQCLSRMVEEDESRRAFNLGSDSRLAGEPPSSNPYSLRDVSKNHHRMWDSGWQDVHQWWGIHAKWCYQPLKLVRWGNESCH